MNPSVVASLQASTGWTVAPDYTRVPTYAKAVNIKVQIQSLTYMDLRQIEGLNLNGTRRAIYANGDIEALVRETNQGGDLITTPDGNVWLVAIVLEHWQEGSEPSWCKVAVTLQNGS